METEARAARRSLPRRLVTYALIAAAVVALGFLGYSLLRSPDRSSYSGPATRFAAAGVTYVANGMLYVVVQPDGGFLALDETPRIHADYLNGCVIRWQSSLQGGIFQEDERCGGALFNRDGTPRGEGLSMLRHPLRLAGKSVVVDIRQCMAPEAGPSAPSRPCSDFHR